MELIRLGILYTHLIACCIAIGAIVTEDVKMVRQIMRMEYSAEPFEKHLESLQLTVTYSLAALWITGVAIIWLDASDAGITYFLNPKLQAKLGLATLLTLNGALLHSDVLPALKEAGSLLKLEGVRRWMAILSGAVSGVSWLYAAMLGVGRPLAWKYSLGQLLAAYPFLVAMAFTVMAYITARAATRSDAPEEPLHSSR